MDWQKFLITFGIFAVGFLVVLALLVLVRLFFWFQTESRHPVIWGLSLSVGLVLVVALVVGWMP